MRKLGIRLRAPTPRFLRAWKQMRAVGLVSLEFVAATILISILITPVAVLSFVAILLTLFAPIIMLVIWGRSLDDELGWQDRIGR